MDERRTSPPQAVLGEQAEVRNKISDLAERVKGIETDCKTYATREWVWSKAFAALVGVLVLLAAFLKACPTIHTTYPNNAPARPADSADSID